MKKIPSKTIECIPQRPLSYEELAQWGGYSVRFLRDEVARGRLRSRRQAHSLVKFLPIDIAEWYDLESTIKVKEHKE